MDEVVSYIASFPKDVQEVLNKIRKTVLEEVPYVTEKISYGIPGYYINGKSLVYFAAYEKHIGFYATPNGHKEFAEEFSKYKQGKGLVQFPLNQGIPYELMRKVVQFRNKNI